jgi:hypothetical protein
MSGTACGPFSGPTASTRQLVTARVVGGVLWILAYAHDGMVDELDDRILRGEREADGSP